MQFYVWKKINIHCIRRFCYTDSFMPNLMALARQIAQINAFIQTVEVIFNENKPTWLALSAILMLSLLLIDLRGSCELSSLAIRLAHLCVTRQLAG